MEVFNQLDEWYTTDLGKDLLQMEQNELEKILPNYFGYHWLQLGGDVSLLQLPQSPISHRIYVEGIAKRYLNISSVCANFADLPFLADSIDLVLLVHTLEFVDNPQNILAEIYRCLIPDGRIIILGFNPSSLWGVQRFIRHKELVMPWQGNFYGIIRLRYWLRKFALVEEEMSTFYFRPPCIDFKLRKHFYFLDTVGQICWPWLGGAYIMVVRKQVSTLTSVKVKSQKLRFVQNNKNFTAPTTRSAEHCQK